MTTCKETETEILARGFRELEARGSMSQIRARLLERVRRNRFDGVAKYWLQAFYTEANCAADAVGSGFSHSGLSPTKQGEVPNGR